MRRQESPVRCVNPLDDPDWDAKIKAFPSASFFHGSAWARVLRDTYGYSPNYFIISETGCINALLPVMAVSSWLTGNRGISLPFTDECEPLWLDPDSTESIPPTAGLRTAARPQGAPASRLPAIAPVSVGNDEDTIGRLDGCGLVHRLFQSALEIARLHNWKYLELRGGRPWLGGVPASESYFGHRLTLLPDETVLFAGVDSSVRRAVRKAETSGLRIEFGHDFDAVQAFHRLLCKTRQRHGLPPQPLRFFAHIQRHVLAEGHGCVVLAKLADEPVAGATFFHFGKTAIYKFGASDESFQELRGNNLVMWAAIKHYAGQGFETMDFGRTSLGNEGLRRFKLSWGTKERQIDYARFDCRSARFVTAVDRSSGWHNRIFRILPPIISRAIGAALYRHIA